MDPRPEGVHASKGVGVGSEEVGPTGEYGEEEALGDTMAKKGSDMWPEGG